MIKIRYGAFETNSSTSHTVTWSKFTIEGIDAYETNFTNEIDLYHQETYQLITDYKSKIAFLYEFVDDHFYSEIREFVDKNKTFAGYIDDLYIQNCATEDGTKFRDFYKSGKTTLFEIIRELTKKEPVILNEDIFDYYTHDSCGYIPTNNQYEEMKELIMNKNLHIIIDYDYSIDDRFAVYSGNPLLESSKNRKILEDEELNWFSFFKK